VKDEGPGLTEEDNQKIFRKFQKLSAKPTAGESSTGLGLSIVYELTKLLKGDIKVVSEEGKGAEFIVYLPVRAA
jgi:signal transduction histidine kinase